MGEFSFLLILSLSTSLCIGIFGTYKLVKGSPVTSISESALAMRFPVYFQSIPIQVVSPQPDLMSQILSVMLTNMANANQNNQTSIPNAPMTFRILPPFNFHSSNSTASSGAMMPPRNTMLMLMQMLANRGILMPAANSTRPVTRSIIFPSSNMSMNSMGIID